MKKVFTVSVLIFLLSLPGFASASSYYMTIEGTVGHISDGGRLAQDAGISVGDTLQYVIEVDKDRSGFTIGQNGKTKVRSKDAVYTSLFSGHLTGMVTKQYNFLDPHNNGFYSQTGNDLSALEMNSWSTDLSELKVGASVDRVTEFAFSDSWGYTKIDLRDAKVTGVSNAAPTPIPGAAVVLLGGLGVLGAVRRKFKK